MLGSDCPAATSEIGTAQLPQPEGAPPDQANI
jgi:hypothetical protein